MNIEKNRLLSLIEFAKQTAKLRSKFTANIADHKNFALHEYQVRDIPGICLNVNGAESDDEVWLVVKRLQESKPPEAVNSLLRPWIYLVSNPNDEPKLKESIDGASLIEAGTHCSSTSISKQEKPSIEPDAIISFSNYELADQVQAELVTYIETKWSPWAKEEKLRRETIRLYSKLFTLKQQLEGGIVESQVELVWGVGIGIWDFNGKSVLYPLVGRLVELTLNSETAEMEIRPRDVDARIEVDWYASVDNPGVANFEIAAKEFFEKSSTTFSPFDHSTFEPLLRSAATNLDANGTYWPDEIPENDRTLPKPNEKLKVTDTWALFARPRTNNLFLQDLEKLKKQTEQKDTYPQAVSAIVTDPETINPVVELPSFRGVSASYHTGYIPESPKVQDLYFPKAFNDEQVRIIQLLEVSDGVVVQGPPGTGKTHTIANVICHYLSEGKRVLVTSMKDPALSVLQEQLPSEIRPLVISLLTSEQDGMKQFEYAIHKIASEVQSLDRNSTARAIKHLEESIDTLHSKLASIDYKIREWAKRNLEKIKLEDEEIEPQDAARELVESEEQYELIPDGLGMSKEFSPHFSDMDIAQLREARLILGPDIIYLDFLLPQVIDFPDSKSLLEVHQDLSQFEKLKDDVERGNVPALANSSKETISLAQLMITQIETLINLRKEVSQPQNSWTAVIYERLRYGNNDDILKMLDSLGAELEEAQEKRRLFLERPVEAPTGVEVESTIINAVANLSEGKRPFGVKGLFGKSEQKKQLFSISVLGKPPADVETWKHVVDYLALLKCLRELAIRWNALANELQIKKVQDNKPEGGLSAAYYFSLYLKIKALVDTENEICSNIPRVFPDWLYANEIADNPHHLANLEKALRHHLTKNRLANVWATKERFQKILDDRSGPVIDDLRHFLAEVLGNPKVTDADMQAKWSALMTELSRVLALKGYFHIVKEVCQKIAASGAVKYASLLKNPVSGTTDRLLPNNWRKNWRLRRLATYLESIDAGDNLKKLSKKRTDVENDLSHAYREIVVKRTWLKLAENASPNIRAALQAYLNAIKKIGKGTGKRAVRYRQDARMAASHANPAVPCWIMAHYRVSESLPAELGCFDLVVIDEASQSDLTALPSLLRAKKVLIVGDDKQVSPEGVGLEEVKIRALMHRFLGNQVETYLPQMAPDRSIYDLFKVVFAKSSVMLKEHFRCVNPIIEYSKREFYNHELRPLRVPKASERLDPPLVDVFVEDGYRRGDINKPEARFIIDEIKSIVSDPEMHNRSIGVVSLLGSKQSLLIWVRLTEEIGPEIIQRHRIACGDARTFQGKERDIMFMSMVSAPNDIGSALSRDTFAQRFNVAASRARDRMYLVRSVEIDQLSEKDWLRRSLIEHFSAPFVQDEERVQDLRNCCESPFEREVYDELTSRGYWVTPQVRVGHYRIDLVVEGHNDSRLAVECDGDRYHGPDKWEDDMQRQRILERAGWVFWRCFASSFIRRRKVVINDLLKTLTDHGVEPVGAEEMPRSVHTEYRPYSFSGRDSNDQNQPNQERDYNRTVSKGNNLELNNGEEKSPSEINKKLTGLNQFKNNTDKGVEYVAEEAIPNDSSLNANQAELIPIVQNKSSGKYFIYLESDSDGNEIVINPYGKKIPFDIRLFEEPEDINLSTLLYDNLITDEQITEYRNYINPHPDNNRQKISEKVLNGKKNFKFSFKIDIPFLEHAQIKIPSHFNSYLMGITDPNTSCEIILISINGFPLRAKLYHGEFGIEKYFQIRIKDKKSFMTDGGLIHRQLGDYLEVNFEGNMAPPQFFFK